MMRARQITLAVGVNALAFGLCFPIVWTFFTGFKGEVDAISTPPRIFVPLGLDKYLGAVEGDYPHFLLNTLIAVFSSMLAAFVLALPAAYRLAFFPGPRAKDLLFFALSTRFMPGVAVIVPIFVVFTRLGLIDSLFGLILIYTSLNIPIVLWLMTSFFREVPFEIIEVALVDGVPHRAIFSRIILPLSIAGLATTGFLVLVLTWNEFFFAVNLTGHNAATLPVYMASFLSTEGQSWARMSAAAILAVLPVLLTGWVASRAFVRGIVSGAVK
jgi:sorbitol/mannitol transport system permease protein